MSASEICWKRLGSFFGHPEPTKERWNQIFDEYLADDSILSPPIVSNLGLTIDRRMIFESLWTQFAGAFIGRGDSNGSGLLQITTGYFFLAVTDALIVILTRRKSSGVGTLKRDDSVKQLLKYINLTSEMFGISDLPFAEEVVSSVPKMQQRLQEISTLAAKCLSLQRSLIADVETFKDSDSRLLTRATISLHMSRELGNFDRQKFDQVVELACSVLEEHGFSIVDQSGRMKNLRAQKVNGGREYWTTAGPIYRSKVIQNSLKETRLLEEGGSMMKRYQDN